MPMTGPRRPEAVAGHRIRSGRMLPPGPAPWPARPSVSLGRKRRSSDLRPVSSQTVGLKFSYDVRVGGLSKRESGENITLPQNQWVTGAPHP